MFHRNRIPEVLPPDFHIKKEAGLKHLNPQQLIFWDVWCRTGNAALAYRSCGRPYKDAADSSRRGAMYLKTKGMKNLVEQRRSQMMMSAQKVTEELAKMASKDGENEFQWRDKTAALHILARIYKLYGSGGETKIDTVNVLNLVQQENPYKLMEGGGVRKMEEVIEEEVEKESDKKAVEG